MLDSSKLKEFADDNFKFDANGRKLSKWVENTVGKGEIARYEQFLLFPQCLEKACFTGVSKGVVVWEWVNPLPNDKILDITKLKTFADNKSDIAKMTVSLYDRVDNSGKRRKCWSPAFSLFPTVFSKTFFFRVVKSRGVCFKELKAEVHVRKDRKNCGKRRKSGLPVFSPFPSIFSKLC